MAINPRQPIFVKYWAPYYGAAQTAPYNLTIEISINAPFVQEDWPVPQRARWPLAGVQLNLTTTPGVPVPPVIEYQPPQFDYPLPPQLSYRERAGNQSSPGLLVAPPNKPFKQTDWPFIILPYRVYAQSYSTPALMFPAAVTPPDTEHQPPQFDYPLPPVQPYREYAKSYSTPYTLSIAVDVPRNQRDWPLPKQPYVVRAEARSAYLPLLQSVQPPISQTSWPSPVQPYIVRATSYGVPVTLLTPTGIVIRQSDWPLPTPAYKVYAEARSAYLPLLHSNKPPISSTDRPVPIQPYKVYAQSYSTPTTLFPPSMLVPNTDFPLPPVIPYRQYGQSYSTPYVLTPAELPIRQAHWPAPIQPPIVRAEARGADIRVLHTTQPPNRQNDWPLPTQAVQPTSARTWIQRAILQVSTPPISQSDWPVPKSARFAIPQPYRSSTLLPFETPPVVLTQNHDWPLPPILPYRQYAQHFSSAQRLTPIVMPSNRQSDWPVPQRAYFPVQQFRQSNTLLPIPTPAVVLTQNHDFPLPPNHPFYWRYAQSYGSDMALLTATPVVSSQARTYITVIG